MRTIEAVTFDFGGTLAHGNLDKESYKNALFRYLRSLGFSGGNSQLRKARNGMLERLSKAQKRNRELRFEDLYQGLLFNLGIHPTQKHLDYIQQLYFRFFKIEIVPGAKEMLARLSKRYKLAIISNATSNASRVTLEKNGLDQYFDSIVISRDLGIRKPDPEIFKFTLTSLNTENKNAVHVGDSLQHDVQGAKKVGMQTVWIKGDNEAPEIHPDFVLPKVTDVISIL